MLLRALRCVPAIWLLLAALLAPAVLASIGDNSLQYRRCVATCQRDTCVNHRPVAPSESTIFPADPLPWYLIALGWTCETNCEYHCTHRITNEAHKRVSDIKARVYAEARAERDALLREHARWDRQRAREAAGLDQDYLCPTGVRGEPGLPGCEPRMAQAPPRVPSDAELRAAARTRAAMELALLSPVERQTVQFFGKWPHVRLLGMQESLSVLFSLLNLLVQLDAFAGAFGPALPNTYPLRHVYRNHLRIASVAWVASAVFHARDLWWTERLDYFSAAAVLLSGLFLSVARLLHLQPDTRLYRRVLGAFVGAWVLHVLYLLSHKRFDYSYNMAACTCVGVVHNSLWLAYALAPRIVLRTAAQLADQRGTQQWMRAVPRRGQPKPHGNEEDEVEHRAVPTLPSTGPLPRQRLLLLVACMFAAPALELFDFPPIARLLDAHALWHLVTVPLTAAWYRWLSNDAHECVTTHWWRTAAPAVAPEPPVAPSADAGAPLDEGPAARAVPNSVGGEMPPAAGVPKAAQPPLGSAGAAAMATRPAPAAPAPQPTPLNGALAAAAAASGRLLAWGRWGLATLRSIRELLIVP